MGTRRYATLLLAVAVAVACNEHNQPDGVTGPAFKPDPPPNPAACDPNSLNSLISGYFPGGYNSTIGSLKQAMLDATTGEGKRNAGFVILDSIGSVSRNPAFTGDPEAGSDLAQGVIRCMFDAGAFSPAFPDDGIYDFAPALSNLTGGAFYVRGGISGGTDTVVGALINGTDITVLSGVAPPPAIPPAAQPTWGDILDGDANAGSEGRVLIYGYPVTPSPLVYEWATIPPAAEFEPGAIVAVCDDNTATNAMVFESSIGVLQYSTGNPICGTSISLTMRDAGWGPRALATRLARLLTPTTLQAAALKSGSGGTVTTVKSKFKTTPVSTVTIKFVQPPPKVMKLNQLYPVIVRATTVVDGKIEGVNGGCLYLFGSNNNGTATELGGTEDASCQDIAKTVFDKTETEEVGGVIGAGYAVFEVKGTKSGGLAITASASDDQGSPIGVLGRDGQTFVTDQIKVNVKP